MFIDARWVLLAGLSNWVKVEAAHDGAWDAALPQVKEWIDTHFPGRQ